MARRSGHYISDRKPLASPVVVPWVLYLAICDMMSLVDSGQQVKALTALEELYLDSEIGPLIRKLEEEI